MSDKERKTLLLRVPPSLLHEIDRLTKRRRRESATPWSRNDQIVRMLNAHEFPPRPVVDRLVLALDRYDEARTTRSREAGRLYLDLMAARDELAQFDVGI